MSASRACWPLRVFSAAAILALLSGEASLSLSPCMASDGSSNLTVVKVEERWALSVGEPNLANGAPQATMTMSPYPDLSSDHFVVTLNHATSPEYESGGIQVQHWQGEELEQSRPRVEHHQLDQAGEVITWRQSMTVDDGELRFEIDDGESESWGEFGGGSNFRVSIPAPASNLNGYRPQISLTDSGVGYGGNRVASLTLLQVRWYLSNGQVYELNAPIDIDEDLDPWN